jgi:hypothetical protein
MPTARFFVSIFALGATALSWLAANPRALAHQNAPPARTPDQSTVWGPAFHQIENDQDLGYVRLQNVTEYLISIQQK